MRRFLFACTLGAVLSILPGASLEAAPPPEITTQETAWRQVVRDNELNSPYQVTGESIVFLLSQMVDFSDPRSSIVFERSSGNIFVKQTQEAHGVIENILEDLRKAAFRQIEIEARFITISSEDFKGMGLDFAALDVALAKAGIFFGTGGLSGAAPLAAGLAGSNFIDFPDVTGFGNTPLGQQLSFFGSTEKINFGAIYDALETQGEVNTLSAPKIMVANNQRAHIRIEKVQNYVAEVNASLGGSEGTEAAIVETETNVRQAHSGTILDVVPTINQNGTITLELHPHFVTANLSRSQTITNVTGGDSFPNSVALPVYQGQSIDTTITIPDGGFAVMGGLIRDEEDRNVESIPGVSKIPLFGKLFSNDQTKRRKSYLMIFVQATEKGYKSDENKK